MLVTATLAMLPVLLVLVLLLRFSQPADRAACIALMLTIPGAAFWCGTSWEVLAKAMLSGALSSLPVVLVMYASMFQITVMDKAGALKRLVAMMKCTAPGQQAVQLILINVGFGIMLTSLGATTNAMFAPIMAALGYSAFISIALPCIGYEALCSYALLAVPIVVFSGLSGESVTLAGVSIAMFMPVMSLCITAGVLWLAGGLPLLKRGLLPALIAGLAAGLVPLAMAGSGLVTLTGVFAGLAVVIALLLLLKIRRMPVFDAAMMDEDDLKAVRHIGLGRAVSPWICLIVTSLLINSPALPFFEWAFVRLSMPIELIPGAPERLRLFWQPWLWVVISTLLCLPLLRANLNDAAQSAASAFRKSLRPCRAALLFFCLAYVMNHSGKDAAWIIHDDSLNMVRALADLSAGICGPLYPFFAPFLGLMGGFLAGSQTSSFAMFTGLHLTVADSLGASGVVVAASSGVGGGLASVFSPSKVLLAGTAIGHPEAVPAVMRKSLLLVLPITAVLGLLTMLFAY